MSRTLTTKVILDCILIRKAERAFLLTFSVRELYENCIAERPILLRYIPRKQQAFGRNMDNDYGNSIWRIAKITIDPSRSATAQMQQHDI